MKVIPSAAEKGFVHVYLSERERPLLREALRKPKGSDDARALAAALRKALK